MLCKTLRLQLSLKHFNNSLCQTPSREIITIFAKKQKKDHFFHLWHFFWHKVVDKRCPYDFCYCLTIVLKSLTLGKKDIKMF